jgi:hypothetical protein
MICPARGRQPPDKIALASQRAGCEAFRPAGRNRRRIDQAAKVILMPDSRTRAISGFLSPTSPATGVRRIGNAGSLGDLQPLARPEQR